MNIRDLELTYLNRISVLRLALDLVKADNCIHGDEVRILSDLQEEFGLTQDDLNRIHYISLQQAADNLKSLTHESATAVINMLNEIMCIDNSIDYEENILLTSIRMSVEHKSKDWCTIISASGVMDETSLKQIIYLENGRSKAVHEVFDNEYDKLLITKAFNDLGLDFFYLPDVMNFLSGKEEGDDRKHKTALLRDAMRYLVPTGASFEDSRLDTDNFNPDAFFHFLLSRYGISAGQLESSAFLLLKIRDSYVLDDENNLVKTVDFLVIDLEDDIKKRIHSFVSNFDRKRNQISYQGCYKILYDYLSSESKNVSQIILNHRYEFFLGDGVQHKIGFESSPQARTFYLLLLKYRDRSISQSCYEEALRHIREVGRSDFLNEEEGTMDIEGYMAVLLKEDREHTRLIYNAIVIYSAISTKDRTSARYLDYIEKIFSYRSSLKNYINKGFMSAERLAEPGKYCITYDNTMKTYQIAADISSFVVMPEGEGEAMQLNRSPLWKMLA